MPSKNNLSKSSNENEPFLEIAPQLTVSALKTLLKEAPLGNKITNWAPILINKLEVAMNLNELQKNNNEEEDEILCLLGLTLAKWGLFSTNIFKALLLTIFRSHMLELAYTTETQLSNEERAPSHKNYQAPIDELKSQSELAQFFLSQKDLSSFINNLNDYFYRIINELCVDDLIDEYKGIYRSTPIKSLIESMQGSNNSYNLYLIIRNLLLITKMEFSVNSFYQYLVMQSAPDLSGIKENQIVLFRKNDTLFCQQGSNSNQIPLTNLENKYITKKLFTSTNTQLSPDQLDYTTMCFLSDLKQELKLNDNKRILHFREEDHNYTYTLTGDIAARFGILEMDRKKKTASSKLISSGPSFFNQQQTPAVKFRQEITPELKSIKQEMAVKKDQLMNRFRGMSSTQIINIKNGLFAQPQNSRRDSKILKMINRVIDEKNLAMRRV